MGKSDAVYADMHFAHIAHNCRGDWAGRISSYAGGISSRDYQMLEERKVIRKIIGAILILIMFAIIFLVVAESIGLKEAWIIFLKAIITTAIFVVGIFLLFS